MGNLKYKVFNEVVVSSETTTVNALDYIKSIVLNNIDNKSINKLIVETYCNFCEDKVISKTTIDFNKFIIRTKRDYTCNLVELGIKKDRIELNELFNYYISLDKGIDNITNMINLQLILHINDIIYINLSPYYLLDDFNYYKDGLKIEFREVYKNGDFYSGIDIVFYGTKTKNNNNNLLVNHIIKLR